MRVHSVITPRSKEPNPPPYVRVLELPVNPLIPGRWLLRAYTRVRRGSEHSVSHSQYSPERERIYELPGRLVL